MGQGSLMGMGNGYRFGVAQPSGAAPTYEWIANSSTRLSSRAESFEVTAGIGKGKFGLVFLAREKESGKYVAIKFMTKQSIFDSQKLERFQQEFDTMHAVHHPFIMEYLGGIETPACVGMVCEFAAGGELYHLLKKRVRLTEQEAKFYFCEIALALKYLQKTCQLVYRDLKPENILIDQHGHVKLCDFGFAAPCNDDQNDLRDGCGTAMYIAPEVASGFMKSSHGFPVDWWALGCILMEMITGTAPFGDSDTLSKFEIFNNITERTVTYPLLMASALKTMLKGLLDKNAAKRFGWQQVAESAWVADVNWDLVEEKKIKPPWIPHLKAPGSTENFIKWDLALPSTPPNQMVQSYCRGLTMPAVHHRAAREPSAIIERRSSFGGEVPSSEKYPLRTQRSAALQHSPSAMGLSSKQESKVKLLVPTETSPQAISRKRSVTRGELTNAADSPTVPSASERGHRAKSSRDLATAPHSPVMDKPQRAASSLASTRGQSSKLVAPSG